MDEREITYDELRPEIQAQISKEDFEELAKSIREIRQTLKPLEDEVLRKKTQI